MRAWSVGFETKKQSTLALNAKSPAPLARAGRCCGGSLTTYSMPCPRMQAASNRCAAIAALMAFSSFAVK
jgi:hypothetical protein